MNRKFSSLIINALGLEAYLSKLGSTIRIPNSQCPEECLWLPLVLVFAFLMDFFVLEVALTPIEVLKLVLESCSGLPCFPFRIFLAIRENWSSTKRFMGAIYSTYFNIIQEKKNASSSFPIDFTYSKAWLRSHTGVFPICCFIEMFVQDLGFLPSPISIISLVFPLHILTLHINPLFSFHLSLISHLMSNFFTGWIIYNSFTNVFFSFL